MLKYIITGAGGILFLASYYFYDKYRSSVRTMRIYAVFAYAGISMMILGGGKILDPYIEMLPGGMAEVVLFGVQAALFVCGAELILKPAFEDRREEKAGGGQGEERKEKGKDSGKSKRIRKRKGKGRNKRKF